MMMNDIVDLVRHWFSEAMYADGPLLPDGWFGGRRGEAGGTLENVQLIDDSLVVRLTDDLTLRFDGLERVFVEQSDLVFGGFRLAALRWKYFGGGENAPYCERQYNEGQIRFVAPIGKKINLR